MLPALVFSRGPLPASPNLTTDTAVKRNTTLKGSIVLLGLSAMSAAFGQAAPTVYGVIDTGIQRTDPKAGRSSKTATTTGINGGIRGGSRFGFRGTEDLGGGLKAIYTIENGFAPDTGMALQGSRLFGRQAFLGLSSRAGTLVAGRIGTFSSGAGTFDKWGRIDPFRTVYGIAGLGSTMSSSASLRVDNALAYVTPAIGGFSAGAAKSWRVDGAERAGGGSNNNEAIATFVNYSAGPLYAVATFDRIKLGELAGAPSQKHLQLGVAYDLKWVQLSAAYAREDDQRVLQSTAQQAAGADAQAWMLGVVAPLGAHRLMGSYQQRTVDAAPTSAEGKRRVLSVGYEYSLSKRTVLYAAMADLTDRDALKTASSGGSRQFSTGLNHSF